MSYPKNGLNRLSLAIWQNNTNNNNRSITPTSNHPKQSIFRPLLITTVLGSLSACISGGGGNSVPGTLTGSVGDGPVTLAQINITDLSGANVLTTNSDTSANYKVTLPTDVAYPVIITSIGGTDIVTGLEPSFTMISTASESSVTTGNINPFSTLIVKTAQNMPDGLTSNSLTMASKYILNQLGFGLDIELIPDPVNIPVTKDNVAEMVKASETLGETIRRTHTVLLGSGVSYSQDELIDSIAADMIDGVLDGRGADGSSPKIAATFNIVAGQVLSEALSNHLKVNDADATELMNAAIKVTEPTSTFTTADVTVTDQILSQAKTAALATYIITPSESLSTDINSLKKIPANSFASDIDKVLPSSMSSDFNDAISQIVTATDAQLESVNEVVRNAAIKTNATAITTNQNTSINIDVLANNGGISGPATVNIIGSPSHGNATLNADGTITYIPDNSFSGTDSIDYEVIVSDGNRTINTIVVEVSCSTCDPTLTLTWNPNPDTVVGYKIYSGLSMDAVTEVSDLRVGSVDLSDANAPSVKYFAGKDLGLQSGDHVCFRIQAYNNVGSSDLSDAICTDI